MRVPRIYTSQPLQTDTEVPLDERAARHLLQVLRMKPGDALHLFNGDGRCLQATIASAGRKSLTVRVAETVDEPDTESPLAIHLGIAISKGERMDWVMQKATELGVAAITPLFSRRVDVKLSGERLEKKQRHWQQILVSACEQCGRNRLPVLGEAQPLNGWLPSVRERARLVLAPGAAPLSPGAAPDSAALLIGPEGGLEDAEIDAAVRSGFTPLGLGPRVLRTETAPVVAIAVLQFCWGDM